MFSHLCVANQLREWDMVIFSSNENQLHSSFLSDQGILRSSKKSTIIKCTKPSVLQDEETNFHCKMVELLGPAYMRWGNSPRWDVSSKWDTFYFGFRWEKHPTWERNSSFQLACISSSYVIFIVYFFQFQITNEHPDCKILKEELQLFT